MNLTGKLNVGMANLAKNMKTGVDNYKVDGKIAEQESRIKSLRKEIANLVMVRLDAGDEMSPEIMERYAAIVEAREVIAELENEKVQTFVTCPNCGAKTSMDMNYCGKCGTNVTEA